MSTIHTTDRHTSAQHSNSPVLLKAHRRKDKSGETTERFWTVRSADWCRASRTTSWAAKSVSTWRKLLGAVKTSKPWRWRVEAGRTKPFTTSWPFLFIPASHSSSFFSTFFVLTFEAFRTLRSHFRPTSCSFSKKAHSLTNLQTCSSYCFAIFADMCIACVQPCTCI